jgi:hypothetical protein
LSSRASVIGVLPGYDLSVDSGCDPVPTLLLALFVKMAMAVEVRRGSRVALLLVGAEVIDCELFEVEGSSNVDRQLCFVILCCVIVE